MFWNGSVVVWKVMIYVMIFVLAVAGVVTALRERRRKPAEDGGKELTLIALDGATATSRVP